MDDLTSPNHGSNDAAPAPAPSEGIPAVPGISMPTLNDFDLPNFASIVPGAAGTDAPFPLPEQDVPEFEVLLPSRSAARRRTERAFVDDEFTAQARLHVDGDLIDALEAVVDEGASDLHIGVNSTPMLRIDGTLTPVPSSEVWDRERVASALYSLMSDDQRARFDENLELDFAFTLSEQARFRVNYYLQRGAIGGAFRLIPTKIRPL